MQFNGEIDLVLVSSDLRPRKERTIGTRIRANRLLDFSKGVWATEVLRIRYPRIILGFSQDTIQSCRAVLFS